MEVLPVIHNVSSAQRLLDFAKLAYSLGAEHVVATKVYGAAAQSGVPDVMRLALKLGKSFAVLPDLSDLLEIYRPDSVIMMYGGAEQRLDPLNPPVYKGRVAIVFNGSEPDFSPAELKYGTPLYLAGASHKLGAIAEAAIVLYLLTRR
ncbi:MAG: RecB-family nuclease [Acidilobaceae archaeon]|nr:RecB-family nuclease [Acidilobaceae archaeon]MCX8165657.1 RecB-family nuclease [Acidilobaceae archaeon]MDW7974082.1 RecB-family nuclease [Sulfolobales archaeon]